MKNPFPGLRPFDFEDNPHFFGRDQQTTELTTRLRKNRFVAVVGTSGSGKSSLVRAGLLPQLLRGRMSGAGSSWETAIMRPGGDPLTNLAEAIVGADLYDSSLEDIIPQVRTTLTRSGMGLVESVRQSDLEEDTNFLLVVDQFEEIFRFRRSDDATDEQAAFFVNLLLEASAQSTFPIYVIITMRSDFLGECSQFPQLADTVNEGEFLIPRLNRDQRKEAILGPAKVAGGNITDRLLIRLLNDIGDDPDQLPILQHALMRTWDLYQGQKSKGPLDLAHYDATGGMTEALSRHADEVLASLPDDEHKHIAAKLFKSLTEKVSENRGIRHPMQLSELQEICGGDSGKLIHILNEFRKIGCTFLTPAGDSDLHDRTIIDISHESLMRVWNTLRGWVDDEAQSAKIYRRLADTANLYKKGKAGLYRNPDLGIALAWRKKNAPNQAWADRYYSGFLEAMVFLDQSQAEAEREAKEKDEIRERELAQVRALAKAEKEKAESERRSAIKLKRLLMALSLATIVAIIASSIAYNAMIKAKKSEQIAIIANENFLKNFIELSGVEAKALLNKGNYNEALQKYSQIAEKTGLNGELHQTINRIIKENKIGAPTSIEKPTTLSSGSDSDDYSSGRSIASDLKRNLSKEKQQQLTELIADGFQTKQSDANYIVLHKGRETIYFPFKTGSVFKTDEAKPDRFWAFEDTSEANLAFVTNENFLKFKSLLSEKTWVREYSDTDILDVHYIKHADMFLAFTSSGNIIKMNLSNPAYDTLSKSDRLEPIIATGITPDQTRTWVLYEDKLLIRGLTDGRVLVELTQENLSMPYFSGSGLLIYLHKSNGEGLVFHSVSGELVRRFYSSSSAVSEVQFNEEETAVQVSYMDGMTFSGNLDIVPQIPFGEKISTAEITELVRIIAGKGAVNITDDNRSVLSKLESKAVDASGNSLFSFPFSTHNGEFFKNSANEITPFIKNKNGDTHSINQHILSIKGTSKNYLSIHPPRNLTDGNTGTKYLNFDKNGSGLIFEINHCQLNGFTLTSADDLPERDPKSFELYGSNDGGNTYYLIYKNNLKPFGKRLEAQFIQLPKPFFYNQYKLVFDTIVDPQRADSFQLAELQLSGAEIKTTWPEYVTYYKLLKYLANYRKVIPFDLPISDIIDYSELPLARDIDKAHSSEPSSIRLIQNGLDGWFGDKSMWSSDQKMIRAAVNDDSNENKYLINTNYEPLDFDLRVSFRIARGNSGINFRNGVPIRLNQLYGSKRMHEYMLSGYQADFSGGNGFWNGKLIVDNLQNTTPLLVANPGESIAYDAYRNKSQIPKMGVNEAVVVPQLYKKYPQWNRYRIICLGDNISIYLNDVKILHMIDHYKLHPSTGKIGLQLLGDGQVSFKDIDLKVLTKNVLDENRKSSVENEELDFALQFLSGNLKESRQLLENSSRINKILEPIAQKVLLTSPPYIKNLFSLIEGGNQLEFNEQVIDPNTLPEFDSYLKHPLRSNALNFACDVGTMGIIDYLIQEGIDVNKKSGPYGFTALHVAVIRNNFDVVKKLIGSGADVNASNINGFTPLIEASKWASSEIVTYLLDHGAEIEKRNLAMSTGLHEIANIRKTFDMDDWTSEKMRTYALSERRLLVFEALLQWGAATSRRNNQGKTAMDLAINNGDKELQKIITTHSTQ